MPLRSLDLFSGVGGITLALTNIAEPVAYCEIDRDCQKVLHRHMHAGSLPKAPVFDDVRTLTASSLKHKRVDLIVGGWPCQDLSNLGLRKGLEGSRSGLISEVFRLTDELQPKALFLENVPPVLNNGLTTIIQEFAHKRGYEMRWAVIPASAMGAPHVRKRWYCLLVKPEWSYTWRLPARAYVPFQWKKERSPRMLIPKTALEKKRANVRAAMMGNSVVPDAVRAAFFTLVEGFRQSPGHKMELNPHRLLLQRPVTEDVKYLSSLQADTELPTWGGVDREGRIFEYKHIPKMRKPNLGLVLDPKAHDGVPAGTITAGIVRSPITINSWSTPRRTSHVSNVLTNRTWRDLPTQVRFEHRTPDTIRHGMIHPCFVEWLMGYPKDWTRY